MTAGVSYTLKEAVVPAGYTKANDITFVINADGTITSNALAGTDTIVMRDQLQKMKFGKIDVKTKQYVSGAKLEVRIAEGDIYTGNETLATTLDGTVLKFTSETEATEFAGIKPDNYWLVEVEAPAGYAIENPVYFTVETQNAGSEVLVQTIADKLTKVVFAKTDLNTNKKLKGATIEIQTVGQNGKPTGTLAQNFFEETLRWVTDGTEGETWTVRGLTAGRTYALVETAAPAGYTIANTMIFNVNEDGTITDVEDKLITENTVVMKNEPIRLEISKTGFTKDGKVVPLQGAKMEIHEKTVDGGIGDIIYNVYGDKMRFESATEAVALNGVVPGTYWLVELEAPEGYMVAEPIEFTINEDMTVSQNPVTLIMEEQKKS